MGTLARKNLRISNPLRRMSCLDPPEHLDRLAKRVWDVVIHDLSHHGVLWKLDCFLIARFCFYISLAEKMELDIQARGAAVEEVALDKHGQRAGVRLRRNPSVGVALDAAKTARGLASELGISPAARTRLQIPAPQTEEDPVDLYLRQRALRRDHDDK